MQLSWSPPDKPNGLVQLYQLYRNSSLVATLTANGTKILVPVATGVREFLAFGFKIR